MSPTGPARRPQAPLALAALSAAALAAACGSDPVRPDERPSAVAKAYLDSALAWEHEVFYWQDRVNWPRQQQATRDSAGAAQRPADAYDAIDYSIDGFLRPAGDGPDGDQHSAFFRPEEAPGVVDAPPDTTRRFLVVGDTLSRAVASGPGRLGYVWFPTFTGINDVGRADSTQAVIRAVDQQSDAPPCGWILDQRFNPGGSIFAMLAGLSPLMGDAPAGASQNGLGGFLFPDDARLLVYAQGGETGIYDPAFRQRQEILSATTNYTLRRPGAPVAVLLSAITASAGEFITLGFRGGSVPSRTFGEATLGLTTVPLGTYLRPDSGYLNITAAIMFDRLGQRYGGAIAPDEPVAGPSWRTLTPGRVLAQPDPVVLAAVRWLQAQPACTGAPAASRGPARARGAAALPGQDKPAPPADRVSRYWMPGDVGAIRARAAGAR